MTISEKLNVKTSTLQPGQSLPLIVEPENAGRTTAQFTDWVGQNQAWIAEQLAAAGGILFRGFAIREPGDFETFNDSMGFELMEYIRGNTPRSVVKNKVYTSTEIRRVVPIPLHNEMSYADKYPLLIAFLCHTPSPVGGETPIADMHEVWSNIPPRIRDTFAERGLCYTQIVGRKPSRFLKKTWTEMFNTEDKAVVERHCAEQKIEVVWGKNDRLKLNHIRPAVMLHPRTGKTLWFNQAHIFHPSFSRELKRFGMPVRAFLLGRYETFCRRRNPDLYPYNCTYGDGGPIDLKDIEEVRDVLWGNSIQFPWQQGDLVLLDNLQVAHSRLPYNGERLILTALIHNMRTAAADAPVLFPNVGQSVGRIVHDNNVSQDG